MYVDMGVDKLVMCIFKLLYVCTACTRFTTALVCRKVEKQQQGKRKQKKEGNILISHFLFNKSKREEEEKAEKPPPTNQSVLSFPRLQCNAIAIPFFFRHP
jgi:hypothetical protein